MKSFFKKKKRRKKKTEVAEKKKTATKILLQIFPVILKRSSFLTSRLVS